MSDVSKLLQSVISVEEIKILKARYFRYTDTKQFDLFRDLFAPDATMIFHDVGPDPKPVDEMMGPLKALIGDCVSVHHGYMPEIEILSDTEARGIWAMEDRLHWAGPNPIFPGVSTMIGYGHYHEKYIRLEGVWKIKSLELTRLRVETQTTPS